MQKKLLATLGIIIIIVAVLLFIREKFGVNLNPLSYFNTKQTVSKNKIDITISKLDQYKKLPLVYKQGEEVAIVADFKNTGNSNAVDTITFKAYLVDGIWDSLKRDIKYVNRKNGATISEGKDLFLEPDLLQMIKEQACKPVGGNCYDNINVNDSDNKFGGVEVKFEEPKYEIKFDSTIAGGANYRQKISFVPENCGYYMLVIGNKKYWSSAGTGNSSVAFIAVSGCDKLGQIASGISDTREDGVKPIVKDTVLPVKELPQAGASIWMLASALLLFGVGLKRLISDK